MSNLAFWLPLLTALIATGSALGGVYLKGRLDRAEKAADRRWEKARRDRDFRRDKAEELYTHLDRYCTLQHNLYINFDFWLSQKLTGKELLEMLEADQQKTSHDATRIKFIIETYYPEVGANFLRLHRQFAEIDRLTRGFKIEGSTLESPRPAAAIVQAFKAAVAEAKAIQMTVSRQLTDLAKLE